MQELHFLPAHRLAALVRAREVSARELLEAHLAQVARHNARLNAIVTLDEERAHARAREADEALARGESWGPLHGVPFTIKDSFKTAGVRTTSSYKRLRKHVPTHDATVVARLKAAGAILLGKTNLPTLTLDLQTSGHLFGRASNPWDESRTPGGSTGGGAAAVAAGMTPFEVGSDLAGSIRVPSHYCGIFGFKPTEHRVPISGHIPPLPGRPRGVRYEGAAGPLARCVEDLRLGLKLLAGPDDEDWDVPPIPLRDVPPCELRTYRIAWTDDFGGLPITRETRTALEKLVRTLEGLGCRVERCEPKGLDYEELWEVWGRVLGAELGAEMQALTRFILSVRFMAMRGNAILNRGIVRGVRSEMSDYIDALTIHDRITGQVEAFLSNWDAWLCPVTVGQAFTHRPSGEWLDVDGQQVPYITGTCGFTSVFNLTGHPVVVLPLTKLVDSPLPLGIQVVGRRWLDEELLALCESLTEITGEFRKPPGF
ncbi:amidase [Archangium sp.]|uniref:amidase n=1 Tax=Archangium sp. TaxID=1872627 RepID=UPI002D4FF0B4|nr:amidase family protein [Archangium sp.]HYO54068.1 amidase family protein [Archangium sp.]